MGNKRETSDESVVYRTLSVTGAHEYESDFETGCAYWADQMGYEPDETRRQLEIEKIQDAMDDLADEVDRRIRTGEPDVMTALFAPVPPVSSAPKTFKRIAR